MSSGFFGVLGQEDSDDDSSNSDQQQRRRQLPRITSETEKTVTIIAPSQPARVATHIPVYEDLSTSRADEETVLQAVYADDFQRNEGVWGTARLQVQVRPPDIEPEHIGSQLL
jgi:hypothetical protein